MPHVTASIPSCSSGRRAPEEGDKMSRLAAIIALVVGIGFVELPFSNLRAQAQVPDTVWRHPPAPGEPIALESGASSLAETPLPQGMSLQALGDLLNDLARQTTSPMRGAQDIAVFR